MADNRMPRQRRLDADALQAIEGNPLTEAEKRMFERFDRLGLSGDQQRERILSMFRKKPDAAE